MQARHAAACEKAAEEGANLAAAQATAAAAAKAQEVLQEVGQAVQQDANRQIAAVVSKCLSAVYGKRYELRINFERRRGTTEADFLYYKEGRLVHPSVDSGGVMDLASLALRLAEMALALPEPCKTLFLDEPFKMVERAKMPLVAKLIETLSVELGVQFVIATHSKELEIGKVVRL